MADKNWLQNRVCGMSSFSLKIQREGTRKIILPGVKYSEYIMFLFLLACVFYNANSLIKGY